MVPALTATAISIPAPAIIRIVFQGTRAMTSFWGARSNSRAKMVKQNATNPTSILAAMLPISTLPGIAIFSKGNTSTISIIISIRVRVVFCLLSNASGFLKVTPLPMLRLLLNPNRRMAMRIREKTTESANTTISSLKELGTDIVGSAS